MDKPEARAAALLTAAQVLRAGNLGDVVDGAEALLPWIESGKREAALAFDAERKAALAALLTAAPQAGVVPEERRAGWLESARQKRADRERIKAAQASARFPEEDQRRVVNLGAGD